MINVRNNYALLGLALVFCVQLNALEIVPETPESELKKCEDRCELLEQDIKNIDALLEVAKKKNSELMQASHDEKNRLNKRINDLETAKKKIRKEVDEWRNNIKKINDSCLSYQADYDTKMRIYGELQKENKKIAQQVEELNGDKKVLERDNIRLKKDDQAGKENFGALAKKYQDISGWSEFERIEYANNHLHTGIKRLDSTLVALQNRLEGIKSELIDIYTTNSVLGKTVEQLQQEENRLKKEQEAKGISTTVFCIELSVEMQRVYNLFDAWIKDGKKDPELFRTKISSVSNQELTRIGDKAFEKGKKMILDEVKAEIAERDKGLCEKYPKTVGLSVTFLLTLLGHFVGIKF